MGRFRRAMFEVSWLYSFGRRFLALFVRGGLIFGFLGLVSEAPPYWSSGWGARLGLAVSMGVFAGVMAGLIGAPLMGFFAASKWPEGKGLSYPDRLLVVRAVASGSGDVPAPLADHVVRFSSVVRDLAMKNVTSIVPLLVFGAFFVASVAGAIVAASSGDVREALRWFMMTAFSAVFIYNVRFLARRDIATFDTAAAQAKQVEQTRIDGEG